MVWFQQFGAFVLWKKNKSIHRLPLPESFYASFEIVDSVQWMWKKLIFLPRKNVKFDIFRRSVGHFLSKFHPKCLFFVQNAKFRDFVHFFVQNEFLAFFFISYSVGTCIASWWFWYCIVSFNKRQLQFIYVLYIFWYFKNIYIHIRNADFKHRELFTCSANDNVNRLDHVVK